MNFIMAIWTTKHWYFNHKTTTDIFNTALERIYSIYYLLKDILIFSFQKKASKQKRDISTSATVPAEQSGGVHSEEEKNCIDKITLQGQKVRDLKSSGASKVVFNGVLDFLLLQAIVHYFQYSSLYQYWNQFMKQHINHYAIGWLFYYCQVKRLSQEV